MYKQIRNSILILMSILILGGSINLNATIKERTKEEKEQDQLLEKKYERVFDLQKNTVSNLDFFTTNYGIFGFDVATNNGGTFWPRGSNNQYIFAGGLWFGTQKYRKNANSTIDTLKYVEITYNPNSGKGWFVPGRINFGGPGSKAFPEELTLNQSDIKTYRTYFSIDFNTRSGEPLSSVQGPNWPIWDASTRIEDTLKTNRYFGYYIPQTELRNTTNFSKGPSYISGEDIYCTYKDTDLSFYEGGSASRREKGYPIKLQFDQMIYSWGFGDYKDFVFLKYEMTNYSTDTLWNCWLAPVMDVDIGNKASSAYGAGNDRVRFYTSDSLLNLAVQWTNPERGEGGQGFGYLGFDFLESPSVIKYYDTTIVGGQTIITTRPQKPGEAPTGMVRKDKAFYPNSEQLGLVTFRNWSISDDKAGDEERYNFIAQGQKDGDTGPGDKRFMMASGPFHMRPSDTVRTVVLIVLGNTSKGGDADGTDEDMAEIVRKDKFAQDVYDANFRAPQPPDRASITKWESFNNSIKITWDSTSEISQDVNERGLDFLGYRIYRARRTNLDTFDINAVTGNSQYPSGKGPLGWKQIAQYQVPTPFWKSTYRSGTTNSLSNPLIDQFKIIGPHKDASGKIIDSMAIRIMRIGRGFIPLSDSVANAVTGSYAPVLSFLDTSMVSAPWGVYYGKMLREDPSVKFMSDGRLAYTDNTYFGYNPSKKVRLFDSVMVGLAYLNRAIIKYNPMFFQTKAFNRSKSHIDNIFKIFPDGIVGDTVHKYDTAKKITTILRTTTDSIYNKSTMRVANIDGSEMYIIDISFKRDATSSANIMKDSALVAQMTDFIYTGIQQNGVKVVFPNFEENMEVRQKVIGNYMKLVSNNRTLIDIGDDNQDKYVSQNDDPTKTERLLNNIDYYYKVLAYDEGDFNQPTPIKLNDASMGLPNLVEVRPFAAPVANEPSYQVTYLDTNSIGGLYNFKLFSIDPDRINQKFSGHEIEMEFQPYWDLNYINLAGGSSTDMGTPYGLYRRLLVVKDLNTKDTIYMGYVNFEQNPCYPSLIGFFTENAASYVLSDTVIVDPRSPITNDFGTRNSKQKDTKTGTYTTGNYTYPQFCNTYNLRNDAIGTLGFQFDFTLQQWAGRFRPDSLTLTASKGPGVTATTPINFADDFDKNSFSTILTTQPVNYDFNYARMVYGSFNNGPGVYEVEFSAGGTETMELKFNKQIPANAKTNTFNVPYLNVKVKNIISYKRPGLGNDSVDVKYPGDMPHMNIDPVIGKVKSLYSYGGAEYTDLFKQSRLYPDPRNLSYYGVNTDNFIGKFNIAAYPFVSTSSITPVIAREKNTPIATRNQFGIPKEYWEGTDIVTLETYSGKQGRYYLTGISIDTKDTVDFVNLLNVSGVQFGFDFANKGATNNTQRKWNVVLPADYNIWTATDFKAGDKVTLRTFGGALGLPMPGAKVRFKISESKISDNKYTDNLLDQIGVAPNPFYISHQGIKSPYDSKLYFTKLPRTCKIEIYTVSGDLVETLNHTSDVSIDDSKASVEIWDLLTKNGMRVQSQSFNAVITTPDGSQTVKTFSVVVGGFRLIEQ